MFVQMSAIIRLRCVQAGSDAAKW